MRTNLKNLYIFIDFDFIVKPYPSNPDESSVADG